MKIAVVSGASSGIGKEFVDIIDKKCGMLDEIWVIARRGQRLEALQHHVRRPLRIIEMDLADREKLLELRALMERKKPQIYVLAASAGFGKYGPNTSLDYNDCVGMTDVNVTALTALVTMSLPYMARGGRILLMASSAAFLPQPGFGIYAATKSYVLSYARSLNQELRRRHIYVTAVCPGPVATEFFEVSGSGGMLAAAKRLFMADARNVARLAWNDSMAKKELSVYGLSIKAFRVLAKVVPHHWILKGMSLFA